MKWLIRAALVGLILTTAWGTFLQTGTIKKLAALVRQLQSELMQVLEASWIDSSGVTHTVKTPRLENESAEAWGDRHKEGVDALKALFPPAT